jgi:hypothetical protein
VLPMAATVSVLFLIGDTGGSLRKRPELRDGVTPALRRCKWKT